MHLKPSENKLQVFVVTTLTVSCKTCPSLCSHPRAAHTCTMHTYVVLDPSQHWRHDIKQGRWNSMQWHISWETGSRGSLFLTCRDFGRGGRFGKSFPICGFFLFVIPGGNQVPCTSSIIKFGAKDQSTVVQQSETTVHDSTPMRCAWARFPDGLTLYAQTARSTHSDFSGSMVYACLAVACHLLLAEWPGSLMCNCSNTESESIRTSTES